LHTQDGVTDDLYPPPPLPLVKLFIGGVKIYWGIFTLGKVSYDNFTPWGKNI